MLVRAGKAPLTTLIAALTAGPAAAWGLTVGTGTLRPDGPLTWKRTGISKSSTWGISAGTFIKGAAADIVIFDPDEEWIVDPEQFASRGRNTPLAGLPLRGRVRMTLLDGVVVYDAADETGETNETDSAAH
jgi:hypothetical protein